MPSLTFYYDVVCPYAYLGSTQVERLAEAAGIEVTWRPILLGGVYKALEAPQQPGQAMPPAKARLNTLDLLRQGELLGQKVSWHPRHPVRSVSAMRLLVGCPDEVRPALSHALYRTYWIEHGDISDRETLARVAADHGVGISIIDDPQVKQALFDTTAEAVGLGGFGVPIWKLTRDDGSERFWWGTDRLPLVAEALGVTDWPAVGSAQRTDDPLPITFFHDVSSPFSYLATTQIERIAAEEGTTIERVPILVGAVFKQIGTPIVPIMAASAPKARYYGQDMRDWAAHWGVPFQMPSAFPLRSVAPLRVMLQDPSTTHTLYRATWVEDRNIGDPEVLRAVLDDAGFDGEALVAGTQDPQIKARLIANTTRAVEAGACGVPSFQVGDALFWGQDRLEHVRQAVRGWTLDVG